MANDLNRWQGIGRLGKDPEVKYMASGDAVANFSIACGSKWKDKTTGEAKESTEWVRISAFRKLAEIIGQYLHKGSQVYVEGRLRTRSYEKDGQTHYVTEVIADRMQMLGGKASADGNPAQPEFADDDIPF